MEITFENCALQKVTVPVFLHWKNSFCVLVIAIFFHRFLREPKCSFHTAVNQFVPSAPVLYPPTFSGGIKMEHWAIKWVNKKDTRTFVVSFFVIWNFFGSINVVFVLYLCQLGFFRSFLFTFICTLNLIWEFW